MNTAERLVEAAPIRQGCFRPVGKQNQRPHRVRHVAAANHQLRIMAVSGVPVRYRTFDDLKDGIILFAVAVLMLALSASMFVGLDRWSAHAPIFQQQAYDGLTNQDAIPWP